MDFWRALIDKKRGAFFHRYDIDQKHDQDAIFWGLSRVSYRVLDFRSCHVNMSWRQHGLCFLQRLSCEALVVMLWGLLPSCLISGPKWFLLLKKNSQYILLMISCTLHPTNCTGYSSLTITTTMKFSLPWKVVKKLDYCPMMVSFHHLLYTINQTS